MISVNEADNIIYSSLEMRPCINKDMPDLQQEFLREDFVADRPLPPFNRVAMDGIAISFESWQSGRREFPVAGIQAAGAPALTLSDTQTCLEVMTGAVLPAETNCVIRYEDIEIKDNKAHLVEGLNLKLNQNIHFEGSDYNTGDTLLKSGQFISGPAWAVGASVGKHHPLVADKPKIALISTGDELVDVQENPLPYQIRRSNTHAIQTSFKNQGFYDIELFHFEDDEVQLKEGLQKVMNRFDVIILSGGVSMGKFDFVPQTLQELGIKEKFHKVKQRPGKPMWFGVGETKQLVFGLPGNPVSALISLHRYVLPAIVKSCSTQQASPVYAKLESEIIFKKELTYFLPVTVQVNTSGEVLAQPVKMNGSGDYTSLAKSDGFMELDANTTTFKKNQAYRLWLWKGFL